MSDHMTVAYAEVLAQHRTPSRCVASADGLYRLSCICGAELAVKTHPWEAHRAHVAAALVASLKNLARPIVP